MKAQAHLFKPSFISLHHLELSPLSLTSPTLSPPHSHSSQLNSLLPPRTHNSQGLPRGVWCLYKRQFHHSHLFSSHIETSKSLAFSSKLSKILKCWMKERRFRPKGSVPCIYFYIFIEFSSLWHFIEHAVGITC